MTEQLKQLQDLQAELHEVNRAFARAALPLDGASHLTETQKRQIRTQLRAAQARWEAVTRQISQVLQTAGAVRH